MANNTFTILRPTLAQELFNHGIKPQSITKSIVYEGRTCYVFTRTPETAAVIKDYYTDIGKPVPQPVQRYLDKLNVTDTDTNV